jgi:gamma-glutamyltranspeptidase/glutathione hydrolase
MNLSTFPYTTRRLPLFATNGVVATSHPLAAQAGLAMLHAGGSAVDAAIATAVALTVLEPTSNGIGSDAFALVWDGERLHGLNGSGRAPSALTIERVQQAGYRRIPETGWLSVTVPGAPAAWQDLHARFGRLPFAHLVAPAISYAEQGYPLSVTIARLWASALDVARHLTAPMYQGFRSTFAPAGFSPTPGQLFVSPGHARSLRRIAEHGAQDFYQGEIATAIMRFAQQTGGLLTAADLATHRSTWVEPISIPYRGYDVWELPPNGQGLAALLALGILEGYDFSTLQRDSAAAYHLQIEAMKLAFADAARYIADPQHEDIPVAQLLDPAYLASRRALIGEQAQHYAAGTPSHGGTVYLCTADRNGQMVSMIQSNCWGVGAFGSGVVVPEWGISLHSRGHAFHLDPQHPNALAPGKRPFHTIIPGFLTHQGNPIGPFGVMGGPMQPQGHVQLLVNALDYGMHPQAALDAPRWRVEGRKLFVELETPRDVAQGLLARGHQLAVEVEPAGFGRGQAIWRLPSGAYIAASESRCDGQAVGW